MRGNIEVIKKIAAIVIGIFIIVILAVSVVNMRSKGKDSDDTITEQTTEEFTNENSNAVTYEETFYSDGTEDANYNYITNANILSEYTHDLPYTVTTEIGDKFDSQFKKAGITGSKLRIVEIKKDEINNSIIFIVQAEDETEIIGTYNESSNAWSF